ncbi:non-reducing end alpha-L-arabinofuranosidase family hydrolase [Sorangium sp. So ce281]|uniref:non-reducing end alpha-L-arabinofuranosidase family hydrolase n=1 Tax=unclassified Sorangium TaxID=2621164 RepID=UPI003F600089
MITPFDLHRQTLTPSRSLLRLSALGCVLAALAGCASDTGDDQPSSGGTGGSENPTTSASSTTGAGAGASTSASGTGGSGPGTSTSTSSGSDPGTGGDPTSGAGGSGGDPGDGGGGAGAGTGAGGSPVTCDLPTTFKWKSGPPVINPKSAAGRTFVSIKDPTIVFHDGKYHVFATVYDTAGNGGWSSVYLNFTDFAQAASAQQQHMANWPTGGTVAPQVFFFRPHNKWYLIFQWNGRYSTNDDINNVNGWSRPQSLLKGEPGQMGNTLGALDFWNICDDKNCHLFFSRDDGKLYRSKVSIDKFPAFDGYETVMSAPSSGLLFEASNVYKVDGTNKYLLMVEAFDNSPRFFRSWTSESLDGPWAPLADTKQKPFAGPANVTFEGGKWSDDISHGEMVRSGSDERMTINACNMQFLYQGRDPNAGGAYERLPYKLGLITFEK